MLFTKETKGVVMETKTKETVVQVKVANLDPSPWNRKPDGNGELKELTTNIRAEGILVPLIVRPIPDGDPESARLEIVAGHRRAAAAKEAGLLEVPCVIRVMDDQEAKKVQVIENLHRKNLNPMEEAKAFHTLHREGTTIQALAENVGKDAKYVYRSLELLKLPAEAIAALESGAISAAHGHQLARVGAKQIEAAVKFATTPDYHKNCPTVEDLKHYIGMKVEKNLAGAPWDKSVPYATKVACKGCPSNTANQSMLFEGATSGYCTNGQCFASKLTQHYRDMRSAGEKKWPQLKFIGAATSRYGDQQTVKGWLVVNEKDPKIKKAIDALLINKGKPTSDGYGFGILKPSNWGTAKIAKLVVLKKQTEAEAKAADRQGYQEATPEQRAAQEFGRRYLEAEKAIEIWKGVVLNEKTLQGLVLAQVEDGWARKRAAPWLNAAGIELGTKGVDIESQVRKLNKDCALLLGVLLMASGSGGLLDELVELNKIDLKKKSKTWLALAQKEWDVNKDKIVAEWKKENE
jgi:ParB/RepB/Spo0J family partition protein